jgi:hypothetical protein
MHAFDERVREHLDENPGDLLVHAPAKFGLVVNLDAARRLRSSAGKLAPCAREVIE